MDKLYLFCSILLLLRFQLKISQEMCILHSILKPILYFRITNPVFRRIFLRFVTLLIIKNLQKYYSIQETQEENIKKRSQDYEQNNNLLEISNVYSSIKETFTRKNIYGTLESQLFLFGLNGTACILKTICQTSEIPIYESNGVFGSLFHIIFT